MEVLSRLSPWHDVLGGALLTGAALATGARGRRAFAGGVAVGLLWEVPFFVLAHGPRPVYVDVRPWPLPRVTQPAVHALWDGGLLLVGAGLCRVLLGRRSFDRFRWSDLALMTAWGAGQELAAELVGNGRVWQWQERPWNPALFRRGTVAYTLLPQLVWTVAPALFHRVLLRRDRRG